MTEPEALTAVIKPLIDQVPFFVRSEAESAIPQLVTTIINDLPKHGFKIVPVSFGQKG